MKIITKLIALSFLFYIQSATAAIETPLAKKFIEETHSKPRRIVRRAAFDIGSGQIKMQVSDVDIRVNKIARVLFTDSIRVLLREDLAKSQDGNLSEEIQRKMISAISQLMKKASVYHPGEAHGIATESLRLAVNGQAFIQRIKEKTGLTVTIISQDEEGILGFLSATNEADIDPCKAVSWDLGSGSFQIAAQCDDRTIVYQGKLGKVPFKNVLLKIQGKEIEEGSRKIHSPNPISKIELDQAVQLLKEHLKEFPFELRQKLNQPDVVVLGIGINPLWAMKNNKKYRKQRILKEIESRLNLNDQRISARNSSLAKGKKFSPDATYIVSTLILTYGIMDVLGIHKVHYVGTQGANSIGLLLSPHYWKKIRES